MSYYERSIKVAFDKISGEVVEADQVFDTQKNGFIVRKQFHRKEVELYCCECGQKLNVSTSKYDRLHFKHEPNHFPCLLTNGKLGPKETEEFTKIFLAKESPRHIELKNKIARKLATVDGVDKSSIGIDNKFLSSELGKRRPDVYCRYFDKEIVFEIQLSNLPLSYILSRNEFYKNKGIYLIWILDNFNVQDQTQLVRDIKYLTPFENFFRLDESSEPFALLCTYKFPFLTRDNQLHFKWVNKSVLLKDITFDSEVHEVYYFNFKAARQEREAELLKISESKIEEDRRKAGEEKAKEIIQAIRKFKNEKLLFYELLQDEIDGLDTYELKVFNDVLNFNNTKPNEKPPLNRWLSEATNEDNAFVRFILRCRQINFNVNTQEYEGLTPLQEVYSNPNLRGEYHLMKEIFERGYNLNEKDKIWLTTQFTKSSDIEPTVYQKCSQLKNRSLVELIYNNARLICIIESAKQQKIIGFNYGPQQWIAFANNAIQYYPHNWEYIELAFKKYGIWDELIRTDKKGTFQKKLSDIHTKLPSQQFDCEEVLKELYPELFF